MNEGTTIRERRCSLRHGWTDEGGEVHRTVTLRTARARDELRALEDFRVYLRPGSFRHVLLTRLITELGPHRRVDPGFIERLSPEDQEILEDAYRKMNAYPARQCDPSDLCESGVSASGREATR